MTTTALARRAGSVSSIYRHGLFKEKVAIVTGGGTGIGRAITQELLHLGCKVMIASRKIERLRQTSQDLQGWLQASENSSQLEFMACNIRQEAEVQDLVSQTLKTFGKLDFLVNNGGGQFISHAEDIKSKGWDAVIETNLTGTFFMCREAYNQWMKNNGGAIVNIVADMWKGFPMMSHTGAARAGVVNLTKSLSLEWVHSGVRINSVAPGSSIHSETAASNYGSVEIFDTIKKTVPYHRFGTVEEVASAVCFLLSPGARFITGETMKVDAGQSLYACPTYTIPEHNKIPPYTWDEDGSREGSSSN